MYFFFEEQPSQDNIIITWLLVFMASLEYQLNPFIFAKEDPNLSLSQHDIFRSQSYLDSQYQLEMLLSQYFDKVLKKLVYK